MLVSDSTDGAGFADVVLAIRSKISKTPGKPSEIGPPQTVLYPPVSVQQLRLEESRLGFKLPPLLRLLYEEIGNGGFGPGGGLLSIRQISTTVDQTVATLYHQLLASRTKRGGKWQEGVVPFCQWGDFILSCVDLSNAETNYDPPIVRFEPNMPEAATYAYLGGHLFRGAGLIPERERLSDWFMDWISNREMFHRPYLRRDQEQST
jgi:hypothetical protein